LISKADFSRQVAKPPSDAFKLFFALSRLGVNPDETNQPRKNFSVRRIEATSTSISSPVL